MQGKLSIHIYTPPVLTFPSRVVYISCDTCPQRGIGLHLTNLALKTYEMDLTSIHTTRVLVTPLVVVLNECVVRVIWSRRDCTRARDGSHS